MTEQEKNKIMSIEKMKEMSIDSFNTIIEKIDGDDLSDSEKIEFFDTFREDIIDMLNQKIKIVKSDNKNPILEKVRFAVNILDKKHKFDILAMTDLNQLLYDLECELQ